MDHLTRLAQPSSRHVGDRGEADELVRRMLAKAEDNVSYLRAVVALCTSRLLMPIIATGDETMHQDPERRAELAAVTLRVGDFVGLLGFTGIDAMTAWDARARPVLCHLDELAASAEPAGANRLLLDVAGPVPFVLDGDVLARLARGFRLVEFEEGGFAWVKPTANEG